MKLAIVCLCAVFAGAVVQDRVKKLTPADLPKVLQSANKALEDKRYGACQRDLKNALGLVNTLVRQQLLAAMPAAPAGFQAVEQKDDGAEENVALAHAMGVTSLPTERTYRGDNGDIKVAIHPDTPMAAMMGMAFNVAAASKDGEVITYKDNKGLLKKEGDRFDLQILVSNKHLIQIEAQGIDDEGLLAMANQAFVDRVVAVLDG